MSKADKSYLLRQFLGHPTAQRLPSSHSEVTPLSTLSSLMLSRSWTDLTGPTSQLSGTWQFCSTQPSHYQLSLSYKLYLQPKSTIFSLRQGLGLKLQIFYPIKNHEASLYGNHFTANTLMYTINVHKYSKKYNASKKKLHL